jgi:hypothetical protein
MAVKKPARAAGKMRRRRTNRARRSPTRSRPVLSARSAEAEIDAIREDLARVVRGGGPARWNADPEDVRRSVMKLVLTLVELIRQVLERQAIRRMDEGTLNAQQTEAVGLALMRLEVTIRDLAVQFDLAPEELNLDLGPIGRLV